MHLRNVMEDLVSSYLEIILRNYHNICKCNRCQLDMTAYALNKLPPKYIISERGFTHFMLTNRREAQQYADIIVVVNNAIEVISSRIRSEFDHKRPRDPSIESQGVEVNDYYFNFPHFVGEVYVDEVANSKPNIKITLTLNGELAQMADAAWKNPYITSEATKDLYNFWVSPLLCDKKKSIAKVFKFELTYKLEGYLEAKKQIQFRLSSEKRKFNYIRGDFIKKIPLVCLTKL